MKPYRVEVLEGGHIGGLDQWRSGWRADYHVVDARGRTVKVYPHNSVGRVKRLEFAEAHAARLNG